MDIEEQKVLLKIKLVQMQISNLKNATTLIAFWSTSSYHCLHYQKWRTIHRILYSDHILAVSLETWKLFRLLDSIISTDRFMIRNQMSYCASFISPSQFLLTQIRSMLQLHRNESIDFHFKSSLLNLFTKK